MADPVLKPFNPNLGNNADPAGAIVAVTKADSDLPDGICRALLVGTAGTANLMDATGATLADVPLQQGYNPIAVQQVRTGGTADDIWALYSVG
jgi:hypothetical protein